MLVHNIQIFVMGSNVWRGEQEWPLARAVATEFALCNGGNLVRRRSISAGDNKKLKERRALFLRNAVIFFDLSRIDIF